tara:strand:+ start:298 stop:561 length:264 start_codon:yes stop_codon:yes gene_type:complete
MSKKYRGVAVKAAVVEWNISEWFTADQLLPKAIDSLPQRSCSINVYSVSRYLRIMASRGILDMRLNSSGVKEFAKTGDYDGDAHFYA